MVLLTELKKASLALLFAKVEAFAFNGEILQKFPDGKFICAETNGEDFV